MTQVIQLSLKTIESLENGLQRYSGGLFIAALIVLTLTISANGPLRSVMIVNTPFLVVVTLAVSPTNDQFRQNLNGTGTENGANHFLSCKPIFPVLVQFLFKFCLNKP